ncbi:hypothetical protein D9M71_661730 [compost metagenome]
MPNRVEAEVSGNASSATLRTDAELAIGGNVRFLAEMTLVKHARSADHGLAPVQPGFAIDGVPDERRQ